MGFFQNLIASFKQVKRDYEAAHPPLRDAVSEGDVARVARLLAAGADVHARDRHGYTAPHWAIMGGGRVNVAELLLSLGADANATDRDGDTPLHHAAACGSVAYREPQHGRGMLMNIRLVR